MYYQLTDLYMKFQQYAVGGFALSILAAAWAYPTYAQKIHSAGQLQCHNGAFAHDQAINFSRLNLSPAFDADNFDSSPLKSILPRICNVKNENQTLSNFYLEASFGMVAFKTDFDEEWAFEDNVESLTANTLAVGFEPERFDVAIAWENVHKGITGRNGKQVYDAFLLRVGPNLMSFVNSEREQNVRVIPFLMVGATNGIRETKPYDFAMGGGIACKFPVFGFSSIYCGVSRWGFSDLLDFGSAGNLENKYRATGASIGLQLSLKSFRR